MALMDLFKKKPDESQKKYAVKMDSRTPSYSSFGDSIMNEETVKTITDRILDEYSKLEPKHIRTVNGKIVPVVSNDINNLLKRPNDTMTTSMFLRRCAWLRERDNNCFIYPTYVLYRNKKTGVVKKTWTALYPLQPSRWEFYQDPSNTIFIKFYFSNGKQSGYLVYNDIIHWTKGFGSDEYSAYTDNSTFLNHCKLNDKMLQSSFKSIESSLTINGIIKIGTLLENEKREAYRKEFEENLQNSGYGIAAMDNSAEYTSIPYNGQNVSEEVLKFFDDKTRRHFGVSEAVLDGDFSMEQREAFYETVLSSGVNGLAQAFNRVLFTKLEIGYGNEIIFNPAKIQFMSVDKKLQLIEQLLPVGGLTINEVRSMFGLPEEEGLDEYMMSLNWINAKDAGKYQVGKDNKTSDKGSDKDGLQKEKEKVE